MTTITDEVFETTDIKSYSYKENEYYQIYNRRLYEHRTVKIAHVIYAGHLLSIVI